MTEGEYLEPHSDNVRSFPEGFLWSSATSPTQIEGETVNEWQHYIARDGTTADGTSTHWRRPDRDLALLSRLKLNSYRFGVDWGRLQPGPLQPFDESALAGYEAILHGLTERGLEPIVTLFHFACPQWLARDRGWVNPAAVEYFLDFVRRLADREWPVRYWITMNEPGVYMTMGYLLGLFPPQKRFRFDQAFKVLEHQSLAHKAARLILKGRSDRTLVGISKHFKRFIPHRIWHPIDRMAVRMVKQFFHTRILDTFLVDTNGLSCDFIGVNYYGRMRIKGFRDISPISGVPREFFEALGSLSDDMWEQDSPWLKTLLQRLWHDYHLPILITELGFATDDEILRQRLLYEHLVAVQGAIVSGVDVRGFSYWSLMDNFEWAEGITKRFGLASVDFTDPDMPRTITPTGHLLARIAGANSL